MTDITTAVQTSPSSARAHTMPRSRLLRVLQYIRQERFPVLPVFFLLLVVVSGSTGGLMMPHDPNAINLAAAFKPPVWADDGSATYLLGTDNMGRDILSRIMAGAEVTLIIALYSIVFSCLLGGLIGMAAGYFGKWVDAVVMRLVDIQMSIPALAFALVLAAVLQPGRSTVVIVVVATYWAWYARIIRGEILSLKERDYIALARVAGCNTATIFLRHLMPNILNTLLVLVTLQVGQVIIFEASLSFLGLGVQVPDMSWGLMLADARNYITHAWWVITLPGIAIMLTCLSANLLGDWMRDMFDPKRRQL